MYRNVLTPAQTLDVLKSTITATLKIQKPIRVATEEKLHNVSARKKSVNLVATPAKIPHRKIIRYDFKLFLT